MSKPTWCRCSTKGIHEQHHQFFQTFLPLPPTYKNFLKTTACPKIFSSRCTALQGNIKLQANRTCTEMEISVHCRVVVHQATGYLVSGQLGKPHCMSYLPVAKCTAQQHQIAWNSVHYQSALHWDFPSRYTPFLPRAWYRASRLSINLPSVFEPLRH